MHWHSEFELSYVVRGRGEFVCGGEKFIGEAGNLLILQPNVLHAACPSAEDGLLYYALVFSPAMLGAGVHDRCTAESIHSKPARNRFSPVSGRMCPRQIFC